LRPPIPGRADYIHYIADLLAENNGGKIPKGKQIKCLNIGVGANCIYPIIGNQEYGGSFVGADVDPVSIASANKIIEFNPFLKPVAETLLTKVPS
jgi:23S rRNA (adenine1618-N6)-methyltransferase